MHIDINFPQLEQILSRFFDYSRESKIVRDLTTAVEDAQRHIPTGQQPQPPNRKEPNAS